MNNVPIQTKQMFNNWLLHLEGINQGQWSRPLVDTLTDGPCGGLFEIRAKRSRRQYRILGCHGPGRGTPTLLWAFIKRDDRVSQSNCEAAQRIRDLIDSDPQKYRAEHDYG
ncbi:MAG: hypothetical protein BZY88_16250 [SAR202 cluster bacterium Io17-Chloro-G9]|nr:MAG: hypothetical protein BZY88_16250 [SAR202 cluster bacterium Io17-Chloro-G9]